MFSTTENRFIRTNAILTPGPVDRAGGKSLGLLNLVMVILRVSYGYGYTRGSGRVGSGSNFQHAYRVQVRVG